MKGVTIFAAFLVVAGALHVKVYRDYEYKGLIYDVTFDVIEGELNCHNLKEYAKGNVGSLKTDTCLIIYEEEDCRGNSFKLSRDMKEELERLGREVKSFHPCNKDIGGDKIQVELMDDGGKTIAEYDDLCGCQDLPNQVQIGLKRMRNFGNCVTVYSSDVCEGGNWTEIPAGQNGLSLDLTQLGYYVRGISGCGSKRACVKLHAEIFKFDLMPDTTKLSSEPKEVALSTKTMFLNNGSAKVFQEYEAIDRVKQSATIEMSRSFYAFVSVKKTNSINGSIGGEVDTNSTFGKLRGSASGYINMAYEYEGESTNTENTTYTYEEEKEFKVKQVIEVPACTRYDVSSTVEVVENYPILYEIFTRVTGTEGERRLKAEELEGMVNELTFVEHLDEYTAVFKTAERMEASVGVTAKISGEGHRIDGCRG